MPDARREHNSAAHSLDKVTRRSSVDLTEENNRPPKLGEFIFYLLLSKSIRDTALGDLAEDYTTVLNKFGRTWAWWFYYCQVAMSVGPLLATSIRKMLKWGVISEAVRRIFS